ncbi:MAG: DUF11 domain-containing protein [Leadbetterella sp.]|nr:DUF11 domain-containing protein [Leadbetterella sp.]
MNHVFTHLFQPDKKANSLLKSALGLLLFIFFLPALAQQAPSNFVTGNETVTPLTYSIAGYKDAPYIPATTFSLNFGKKSASQDGFNRVINSFQVGGRTYVRGVQGNSPFTKVILKRIDNASVTGNKATSFFEVNADQANNTLYVTPAYVDDMEGLINSYVFNRGSDNVFSNSGSLTLNNVERIDMLFEGGIKAPANAAMLNRSGVLIMERGGNDSFKFAVIKSLSGGQVATLGDLKTADRNTAWGSTGVDIKSVVFQRDGGDNGKFKPNQYLDDQTVHGTFITLQDMGVGASETIYGISIFANDVTAGDLVGMTSGYPTDTDGSSSLHGGLDFMAGGGFFTVDNNVGGRIFHDAAPDPSAINAHTGGKDGSQVNALELYVSLLNAAGDVMATVKVENGGYTFYDVPNGSYKLVLHKTAAGSATPELPDGWARTGEGANGVKDGTADGIISFTAPATGGGNLITNNFGIDAKPTLLIDADDDDFGTHTSTVAYTTPKAVFANDTLNNVPVDPALVTLKVAGAEVTAAVIMKDSVTGADVPGVRLNPDGTVTVDAGTPDGTYTLDYTICEKANADNCDEATILIRVRTDVFDLALRKEVKAGQKAVFKEGDEVTFVINIKNEGTVDATDVEVVDYVPEGLELTGTTWTVTDGKAKLVTPIASLPAGEDISIEITFKVTSGAKPTLRNAAEISAAKGGTDVDSVFDEDRNNDKDDEDDFDTSEITICKKGGNCLPVKTTKIH